MAKSKNYDELLYYWHAWHEATGPQLKNKYIRYVQLANQAARLNGDRIKIIFKRVHINIFSKNFPFSRISFDLFRISECRWSNERILRRRIFPTEHGGCNVGDYAFVQKSVHLCEDKIIRKIRGQSEKGWTTSGAHLWEHVGAKLGRTLRSGATVSGK